MQSVMHTVTYYLKHLIIIIKTPNQIIIKEPPSIVGVNTQSSQGWHLGQVALDTFLGHETSLATLESSHNLTGKASSSDCAFSRPEDEAAPGVACLAASSVAGLGLLAASFLRLAMMMIGSSLGFFVSHRSVISASLCMGHIQRYLDTAAAAESTFHNEG